MGLSDFPGSPVTPCFHGWAEGTEILSVAQPQPKKFKKQQKNFLLELIHNVVLVLCV